MTSIRLAFKKGKGCIANSIKFWTHSKYSHVEIIIGNPKTQEKFWISSNPDYGGVRINKLRPYKITWDYIDIPALNHFHEAYNFARSQEGTSYDWCGILCSQFMHIKRDNSNKWFCSELVTTILQLYKIPEVENLYPASISPGDLDRLFYKYIQR